MESLTISLKETFRKGIANSKIQSVCQFGEADYLISTNNQVFHFIAFKDSGKSLSKLNCAFKTSIFIKDLNIICAIGSSLPNILFFSTRSGFPLICEAYRLSSTLYDSIQYSPKSKKLIVSGDSVEIFDLIVEWKLFEIDPMITLVNKLSFSCERMTSNVYLDEMRQILIIPSLFGISTVDMTNLNGSPTYNLEHSVKDYQLGNIPFQTMAFYNSQKVSKQRSISNIPFKSLITTNSNGDISLWNSSSIKKGYPIQNFKKFNEVSILCEFVDNEFCLFVTESKPNYFVILFDIKTGKTIKLTSFDTKVIKMNVHSKRSVSFLTENFFVAYQLNIPWHLFSKTASNAVAIRRYPTFSFKAKAARVAALFNDGIVSLFSPDVHFLLTEIGTTCSSKIIDFIYDRSSSLRIRNKIISVSNADSFKIFTNKKQSNLFLNSNLVESNLNLNANLAKSNSNLNANLAKSNPNLNANLAKSNSNLNPNLAQTNLNLNSNLAKSNSDLNANLATSNIEKTKTVSFDFSHTKIQLAELNQFEKESEIKNENSDAKSVSFLASLIQLRKKQETRKLMEIGERFIFLLDDGSVQVFSSNDDHFTPVKSITAMNLISLSLTYIKSDESVSGDYFPVFIGFNKEGELLSFSFDSFEVQTRTSFTANLSKGRLCPLFVCIHHRTNTIYAVYENQLLMIDASTKKVIQTEPLNSRPKVASLEDDLFLIVYESRAIEIRHLNDSKPITVESIKLLEDVTFAIVQYETFIIVTDDKTVRIGHSFDNCAIFELPFKIFSAGFLNPDLDLALGLDFEVMVIRRCLWYPFIERPFKNTLDSSDPKREQFITAIHDRAVLYNIQEEEGVDIGDIMKRARLDDDDDPGRYSSSSLEDSKGNDGSTLLSFAAHKANKSAVHFDIEKVAPISPKSISHHKSAPNIIKLNSSSPHRHRSNCESADSNESGSTMMNRKKKLPELKNSDELMMNNKLFRQLFKDVGSGLNEGRSQDAYAGGGGEPDACGRERLDEEEAPDESMPRAAANASATSGGSNSKGERPGAADGGEKDGAGDDDEGRTRKRVKRKKRVARKSGEGGEEAEKGRENGGGSEASRAGGSSLAESSDGDGLPSSKPRPQPPAGRSNAPPNPRLQLAPRMDGQDARTLVSMRADGSAESGTLGSDEREGAHGSSTGGGGGENEPRDDGNGRDSRSHSIEPKNDTINMRQPSQPQPPPPSPPHLVVGGDDASCSKCSAVLPTPGSPTSAGLRHPGCTSHIGSANDTKGANKAHDPIAQPRPACSRHPRPSPPLAVVPPDCGASFSELGLKSRLTMSSPDLLLHHARAGKVRLTVEERRPGHDQSGEPSMKKLPLITVHLIQKKVGRTKSEYSLLKSVGQPAFEGRAFASESSFSMRIQSLVKSKNRFVSNRGIEKVEKKETVLMSIKPLFPAEKQPNKRKGARNTKAAVIPPKRSDRQPLGNIELAIQVFRPKK